MRSERSIVVLLLTPMVGACDQAPEESISDSAEEPASDPAETGGCRSRGPSRSPTKDVKGTARGDFDGDGRYDTVIIYDPVGSPEPLLDEEPLAFSDDGPYRVRIEFGAGGTTDEELPDGGTVGSVIDVNGDSRHEVVVDLGGNTGFSVHFATVVACRAVVARGADGLPAGFGYYGHSMGVPGSVGTHCLDGDGDGRFDQVVQVSSEPVGFPDMNRDGVRTSMDYWEAGPAAVDHFSWERQTYILKGAEFRLVEDAAGRYERSERSEGQLELSNDLACEANMVEAR